MNSFIKESIIENLSEIEGFEKELEVTPENKKNINKIYKAFHSIKGLAVFDENEEISEIINAAEFVLDGALKDNEMLNEEILKYIIDTYRKLEEVVEREYNDT